MLRPAPVSVVWCTVIHRNTVASWRFSLLGTPLVAYGGEAPVGASWNSQERPDTGAAAPQVVRPITSTVLTPVRVDPHSR